MAQRMSCSCVSGLSRTKSPFSVMIFVIEVGAHHIYDYTGFCHNYRHRSVISMTEKNSFGPKCHGCLFFCSVSAYRPVARTSINLVSLCVAGTTKKDTSVTFWAERIFFCHTYDTFMTIIVTKPGIIIDVVGSSFYDKNHDRKWACRPRWAGDAAA